MMYFQLSTVITSIAAERARFIITRVAEMMATGMPRDEAVDAAADEWNPSKLAPEGGDCQFSEQIPDAYGTGDSPTMTECKAHECPWGKRL